MIDEIVVLRGPERIRKRPAVAFGCEGIDGGMQVVRDLLHIFATESQLGYCKCVSVTHNGAKVRIQGDDRGINLGQATGDETTWKNLFEDFYCPPREEPNEEGHVFPIYATSHCNLYGDPVALFETLFPDDVSCFELYCAQCACKVMDVISVRDGVKSTLHFEKGYNVGGIRHERTDDSHGTCFDIELDPEVFTETAVPKAFFLELLERLAMLSPGMTCTYDNESDGEKVTFAYPRGIAEYAERRSSGMPVYNEQICGKGKNRYNKGEYEAWVEVALAPALGQGSVLCLHNYRELTYGGTHYRQLQKKVCDVFAEYFPETALTFEELSQHLVIVLASRCAPRCSCWENASRLSIANQVIADMTEDVLSKEFANYVYDNREILRPIVDAILAARK